VLRLECRYQALRLRRTAARLRGLTPHLINEHRHYRAPIQQYTCRLLEGFLVVTDSRKPTFSLQNSAVIKKKGTGAMSGKPGRSGRKSFVATPEQRNNVKILVGLGVPQAMICQLVVNPQTGKPLDEGTLKKHFPREIAVGAAELHARMGSFMVANIFGMTPPAGTQPIKNESSRAMLSIFFAKTRMGWKETVVSEHANADGKPFIFEVSKTDAKL
jgi:hypothetical protein